MSKPRQVSVFSPVKWGQGPRWGLESSRPDNRRGSFELDISIIWTHENMVYANIFKSVKLCKTVEHLV